MSDPFAHLKPIDLAGVPDVAAWTADLVGFEEWAAELQQPISDAPAFDRQQDPEVDVNARLDGDRRHVRTPTRRLFIDYRPNPQAYKHLDPLPALGESLHGVISGKYALFELIAALIEKTGQSIEDLTIATLSFSKANAGDLLGMLDAGQVKRVSMLISYYFKSTSRPIYDALIPQLRERGMKVLAMRTHCKILLMKMEGGACYVAESSANLRSSVNVEQFVLTQCPALYAFHHGWIEGELLSGKELGSDATQEKAQDNPDP